MFLTQRRRFIAWIAAGVISLALATGLPLLTSMPGLAQTAPPAPAQTITVTYPGATVNLIIYAAVSLREAIQDLENGYNNSSSTPKINFTNKLDSSGILLNYANYLKQQNPNTTEPAIFISAARSQITSLQTAGEVATSSGWPKDVARNKLVLIRPTTYAAGSSPNVTSFSTLVGNGIRGIAIGDPTLVPAGNYAKELLTNTSSSCGGGTYNTLLNNPAPNKLFFATNVRNVLSAVETKTLNSNVIDAGIVYFTDKQVSTATVQVGSSIPYNSSCFNGLNIVYPEAVLTRTPNLTASNNFANYLLTAAGKTILQNRGFTTP